MAHTYPLKSLHALRLHRAPGGSSSNLASLGQAPSQPLSTSGSGGLGPTSSLGLARAGSGDASGAAPASLELQLAQHHSVPEHRGEYGFGSLQEAMFFTSLSMQLLR